jgi:futalosine hydrolase
MSFKILYVTATLPESETLKKITGLNQIRDKFFYHNLEINVLISGVGSVSTAWMMTRWISGNDKPDLAINAGIAGSYKDAFPVGSVLMPVTDCFADAGIEDGDRFLTLHESGLVKPDDHPFRNGLISADNQYVEMLKKNLIPVKGITVNTASGNDMTIKKLRGKFDPDIETMEGAAFFYICARERIPFAALRAISNMVERRDRNKWNIPEALNNLSSEIEKVFKMLV